MMSTVDIVIVGGGIAGVSAAIAAAREGKDVLLIEKRNSIGGDSAYANVGTICGAYYRSFSATPTLPGYDFSREFINALHQRDNHARAFLHTDGLHIIPYEWSILQQLYLDLLNDAGVKTLLAAELQSVSVENETIYELQVYHQNTLQIIKPRAVVDCTGQAWVSQLMGIETIKEDIYQAASQVFRLSHITETTEYSLNMALKRAVIKNITNMHWPASYKSISVVPGSLRNGHVDLKFTLPENVTDQLINDNIFKTITRNRTEELILVIKSEVPSLEESITEIIFPYPGIRVVQRSKGRYVLTEDDVLNCSTWPDGIASGTWPIEIWKSDGSLDMRYFAEERAYQIPARCLISEKIKNLYFAGKNISATNGAIASARVMGTILQTGYAAGKMACATNDSELKLVVSKLHNELQ